ncbi:MAG: ABC transporter substrate-binding protein [Christensenellaceae bacterium]|jgi:spermidine/putrescine-binding protein|nr:ABC transporter substrate-binding protein [Christensenellaceae bacterium]
MKRFIAILIIVAMSVGVLTALNVQIGAFAAVDKLYVYNWGDYIDMDAIAEFESEFNIDVVYSTFDTNEIMLSSLQDQQAQIDLICPSDYALQRLIVQDRLEKIDFSKLSNYSNINSAITTKVDANFADLTVNNAKQKMSDYFIPYMMGTVGIVYNTSVIDPEVAYEAGYGLLWNTPGISKLNRKILMKDSVREAYLAGVFYLKESGKLSDTYNNMPLSELINYVDDTLLSQVEEAFKEQHKVISSYEVDFGKTDLVNEKAYAGLAWSGDALWAMEDLDTLDYYVPKIGGNIWFDGWAMLKNSQNKESALKFMDFMMRPDIAMRNAMAIGYTSCESEAAVRASATALDILEENDYDVDEFFGDSIRYPDISDPLLVIMKDFSDDSKLVAMWERVKTTGLNPVNLIIIIVSSVVGVGIIILVIFLINKKKKSRRAVAA